jgi:tripartite-type tricarboxylate transporter receptor subunit TctC
VPFVLLAAPAIGATDLPRFVAAARAVAGAGTPFFYGSTGPGSIMNLIGEVLRRDAGIAIEHVPFRGAAPLVQEMLAGRIQLGGDQLSTSLANVRSGALRGLAVLSAARSPALPDLPTVRESGLPSLEFEGWNGLFTPARTPPEVIMRLQAAAADAIRQPEPAARLATMGAEAVGSDAGSFGRLVSDQFAKIRALVVDLRLRPE